MDTSIPGRDRAMGEILATLCELKNQGRRLVGCFPLYPPLELLHSFGLTPVTLWGLSSEVTDLRKSDRHLQNYTCHVARCLTEFVLGDAHALLDALFMYNACDTLRNLPEIIEEGLKEEGARLLPLFRLHVPAVAKERTGVRAYLKDRVTSMVCDLEEFTGRPFSPETFLASIDLYRSQRELCAEIEDAACRGMVPFPTFVRILQLAHVLPVEAHLELLDAEIPEEDDLPPHDLRHPGVMISGILPPPRQLLETMEASGLRVVANDIASLKRSLGYNPAPTADPGEYYGDFYLNHYPCSTLLASSDRRIETIRRAVHDSGAEGFIFFGEKFCEYEYFEFPHLEGMLRAQGIQTLFLELTGQTGEGLDAPRNRLEAFAEMLKGQAGS